MASTRRDGSWLGGDRAHHQAPAGAARTVHARGERHRQHREVDGGARPQLLVAGAAAPRERAGTKIRVTTSPGSSTLLWMPSATKNSSTGYDASRRPARRSRPRPRARSAPARRPRSAPRRSACRSAPRGTRVPLFLRQKPERLAPEVGLVVVGAARVEAQVAAERAHVAELRTRDESGRLGERREVARASSRRARSSLSVASGPR